MKFSIGGALLALYWWLGVCGTHNQMRMQETVWSLARDLRSSGVPLLEIDAGQQWGGWHLYEFARNSPQAHRKVSKERDGWFIALYLPVIDRRYAVFAPDDRVGAVQAGLYEPLLRKSYRSICRWDNTVVVGIRRESPAAKSLPPNQ